MAKKHSFDYFEAFVKAVDSSCAAASLLNDTLRNFDPDRLEESMTAMHKIEHAADGDKHRMMKVLIREFLPPIEREDVTELTQKIDDVTDALEDVLVKIYTFNIRTIRPEALEFMDIIVACCCSLKKAVQEFRNFKNPKKLRSLLVEVNTIESEADAAYMEAIHHLFGTESDFKRLIGAKAIFDCLEECCDLCEHAADVMDLIIIKNT